MMLKNLLKHRHLIMVNPLECTSFRNISFAALMLRPDGLVLGQSRKILSHEKLPPKLYLRSELVAGGSEEEVRSQECKC